MNVYIFEREQYFSQSIEEVFKFFADARNLEAITPPWLRFQIVTRDPLKMCPGAQIRYSLRWHGIPLRWVTEIEKWNPPYEFIDVQMKGPYKLWRHTHRFVPLGKGAATRMIDRVEYALPFDPLSRFFHQLVVRRDLDSIFDYRSQRFSGLLETS